MELEQSPLNVLCELCKADFPADRPWPYFEIALEEDENHIFRCSNIKQIRDSVASGCHVCSLLWADFCQENGIDEVPDEEICDLIFTRHADRTEIGIKVYWRLLLRTRLWKRLGHVELSSVTGMHKRVVIGQAVWEIDASKLQGPSMRAAIMQHPSATNVGHQTIPQISKWLHACENEHERCKANVIISKFRDECNFRLINVGIDETSTVHLVNTVTLGHVPRYATLSHRWTGATKFTQLTWGNVEQNFKSINTIAWPQVYRDALLYTRKLGMQYLWIDSICIIQNYRQDLEKQDWDEQSVLMDQIYANSVLNLGSIEETSNSGFTVPRDLLTETPCLLESNTKGDDSMNPRYLLHRRYHYGQAVSNAPLSKRGWVFQERLLPKRAVHFGHQIHWECLSMSACESFPHGYEIPTRCYNRSRNSIGFSQELKANLYPPATLRRKDTHYYLYQLWSEIVWLYSQTKLSNPRDRLIALRGIVNVIIERFNLPTTSYAAGMWESSIPLSLLWLSNRRPVSAEKNALSARQTLLKHFPSWSWASRFGPITNLSVEMDEYQHRKYCVKAVYLYGSDDKATSAIPTQIVLHGWTGSVELTSVKPDDDFTALSSTLTPVTPGQKETCTISWDAPVSLPLQSVALLPILLYDGTRSKGLVLQAVDTKDQIPTCIRIGCYTSFESDPVMKLHHMGVTDGIDWDQKLLSAPLIRLV